MVTRASSGEGITLALLGRSIIRLAIMRAASDRGTVSGADERTLAM